MGVRVTVRRGRLGFWVQLGSKRRMEWRRGMGLGFGGSSRVRVWEEEEGRRERRR